jgi:hypothetical protein
MNKVNFMLHEFCQKLKCKVDMLVLTSYIFIVSSLQEASFYQIFYFKLKIFMYIFKHFYTFCFIWANKLYCFITVILTLDFLWIPIQYWDYYSTFCMSKTSQNEWGNTDLVLSRSNKSWKFQKDFIFWEN